MEYLTLKLNQQFDYLNRFVNLLQDLTSDDEFNFKYNGKNLNFIDGNLFEASGDDSNLYQLIVNHQQSYEGFILKITIDKDQLSLHYKSSIIPKLLAQNLLNRFFNLDCNTLSCLNHPPLPSPSNKLLHTDFLHQAQINKDCTSVDFYKGGSLTYSSLHLISAHLSSLIKFRDQIIPLLLPPSLELYVGYISVLRSGNAFSPFDCQAPLERLLELTTDLNASLILGTGQRPDWIPENVDWIDVTDFITLDHSSFSQYKDIEISPNSLAYVLFTSGSTGKPKGVQIQHSAAAASIASHLSVRKLDKAVRWFQFAPSTFDPSIMETFMSFSSGATICAAPRPEFLTNPEGVLSSLKCTHMMATPSIAALLNPNLLPKGFELWTMGEKLNNRVIENFTRPGNSLYNAYGPTEAAINVTLRSHPPNESGACLGPPLPSSSLMILHPTKNKLVPMGFAGELAIGGPQLAKGYLNMPEQTAKVFIDIPELGRVYRTGDKARVVLDSNNQWNNVEYLGRIGMEQVKLNGKRVELGEIDTILSLTKGIRSVHTVVNYSNSGAEQLCAFITPSLPNIIDKVFKTAASKLPSHMQPVAYFVADDVPRSTAGKADRKAITRFVKDNIDKATFVGSHENSEENNIANEKVMNEDILKKLISCVSKTVGLSDSEIDPFTNLLTLGIDSLRGVRFLSLARETGLGSITIEDVIKGSTLAKLSNIIHSRSNSDLTSVDKSQLYETIEKEFRQQALPAVKEALGYEPTIIRPTTTMQTGLLALYSKTSTGYINHSVYSLKKEIDVDRLRKAWIKLVDRHEILRTRFVLVDNSSISAFSQVVVNVDSSTTFKTISGTDVNESVNKYIQDAPSNFSLLHCTQSATVITDGQNRKLVVSLHHALFDGASLALMLDELSALYNDINVTVRRESFVNALTDVYTADTESNGKYWTEKLQNFTPDPFPDLTGLRQDAKSEGHHVSNHISSTSFSTFLEKARAFKVTPLSIVQAAWASILLAYSESDANDIVFGSIVGGRTTDELEHTVGPVFTASPIRVTNPQSERLSDVISSLVSDNVDSLIHRHLPPKVLSGDNGIIYDTTIALQQFAQGQSQTDLWNEAEYPPMVTEFAVVLEIWPDPNDTIRLRATCSNNVLIPQSSQLMLQQFDGILSSILNGSHDRKFADVAVDVDYQLKAAVNPNPQRIECMDGELIHHQFEINAKENPDTIALWFKRQIDDPSKDIKLTYSELDARANKVANYLFKTYGDLTDTPIPIHIEKSPEMFIAILAIVKSGGAWCPIDTAAPSLRKKDLFERANGPVILVRDEINKDQVQKIVEGKINVISLDDGIFNSQSTTKPTIRTNPNHLAYLIWTSGTTGAPKGVPIEHSAAVQSLTVLQTEIPWTGKVRCLNFSAYTFDVSVLDIFYALGKTCGTLCSSTRDNLVGAFEDLVHGFEATHAFLTPAFMAQSSLSACDSLQSLISIGEKLPQTVADAWCNRSTVSLNTYGPAESTIIATYRRWEVDETTKAHNVGLPLSTISCFVVEDDRILLRGAVGELALGGFQNARGYHNQREQTEKKFINHPQAGKVYCTGDVVRLLHDGSCEFVGRNDDLVKLGGIRVELSEISAALSNCHELARETTTLQLARKDRPQKVVCTFVAAPGCKGDGEEGLRTSNDALNVAAACKEQAETNLPAYMVPNVIIVLTVLPHTPSNKIDRKALAAYYEAIDIVDWEQRMSGLDDDDDSIWTDVELKIREVVANLTNVSESSISKSSHLPALGVDSIRSLQLASKLRNVNVNVAVSQIAAYPTIKQLSKVISRSTSNDTTTETPQWMQQFNDNLIESVQKDIGDVEFVLPCTPTQEGMLSETVKNFQSYWSHQVFELDENVNVDRLLRAWEVVANKNQALRTCFVPTAIYGNKDAIFAQCILSSSLISFEVVNFYHENQSEFMHERVRNIVSAWSNSNKPPVNLTLALSSNGCRYIITSLHHAIYDGDSLDFIFRDVESAYKGIEIENRTSLKDSMSIMNSVPMNSKETKEFWSSVLEPFNSNATWPILHDDSNVDDKQFWTKSFKDVNRANINQLLQVAWAILQSLYTGANDVVFGETISLRNLDVGLESVVAPMIATLPVVVKIEENSTARSLINELSKLSNSSANHKCVSLKHVRKALKCPIGSALFPALFVLIVESNSETETYGKSDLWCNKFEIGELDVEHPVAINAFINGDNVQVDILGSNKLMSEKQVEILAQQMQSIVTLMTKDPDASIHELTGKINGNLLATTHVPSSQLQETPLSNLVKNSKQRPNDVAVVFGESYLTFDELEKQSNKVANFLTQFNDQVIGFCVPKSIDSLVYQIAIFKSACTYLPISETLPSNRKRLIARSSNAKVIFTNKELASEFTLLGTEKVILIDDEVHTRQIENQSMIASTVENKRQAVITYANGQLDVNNYHIWDAQKLYENASSVSKQFITNDQNKFLNWIPVTFELHIIELLVPLLLGSTIICERPEKLQKDVRGSLISTKVTYAFLNGTWFEKECIIRDEVPDLQHILLCGNMSSNLHESWDGVDVKKIFSLPGISIVTFVSNYKNNQPHHLGKPINSLNIYKLNTDKVAIRGESGELVTETNGKYKRSGIVARMIEDDNVLYECKKDDIVDYRGNNINVEKVSRNVFRISSQNIICQTLVLSHPEGMQADIVTFISRKYSTDPLSGTDTEVSEQDQTFAKLLLLGCKEKLSQLECPDIIIPLKFLPISNMIGGQTNVKILLKLFNKIPLRKLVNSETEKSSKQRQLTPQEERISIILSEETGVDNESIQPSTTTLELGIDSLSAISLSYKFKANGLNVPPHIVLSGPTVEKLAKISGNITKESHSKRTIINKLDDDLINNIKKSFDNRLQAVRPCLPLQEGLVARTFNSTEPVYVNSFRLKLDENVEINRLIESLNTTIISNDILRTCFYFGTTAIAQVVLNEKQNIIKVIENESEDQGLELLENMKTEVEKDVVDNIQSVVPLRIYLSKSNKGKSILQLTLHHAIYDGESLPMLLDEIKQRYNKNFNMNRTSIERLLEYVSSQSLDNSRAFFAEYLSELPQINNVVTEISTGTEIKERIKLVDIPLDKLEQVSRSINVSLRVLVQSIFGISLGECQGVSDVTTGVVLSGRTVPVMGVNNMLAPCITTVPVRVKVLEPTRVIDIVQQAQSESSQIMEYQFTPLRLIQQWIGGSGALFNSLFSFNIHTDSGEDQQSFWKLLNESSRIDYPMALEAASDLSSNKLILRAVYNPSFGQNRDVEILLNRMNELVKDVQQIVNPLLPISLKSNDDDNKYNDEVWSEYEEKIREIVGTLCKIDKNAIKKDSTFISLGIDSISSVRLAQNLRKNGFDIPTHLIMRSGCIGALSQYLQNSNPQKDKSINIQSSFNELTKYLEGKYKNLINKLTEDDKIEKIIPATALQTGMLTQTITSGGKYYNISHLLSIKNDLSIEKLKKAWMDTINSIDILRSTFHTTDEINYPWIIAVHRDVNIQWNESEVKDESEIKLITNNINMPKVENDFERVPMSINVVNIKSSNSKLVILNMHHALYDGVSLPLVLKDVKTRYNDQVVQSRPQFSEAVPYIVDVKNEDNEFWKKNLDNYVNKFLPKNDDNDDKGSNFGSLSIDLTSEVTRFSKLGGVSLQSIILLAWGKTIGSLLGSIDIVFGQVIAGRSILLDDALKANGPLFNTIPYRFMIKDKNISNIECCKEQYKLSNQIEEHQHVPLRDIQKLCKRTLFDSLLVFQKSFEEDDDTGEEIFSTFNDNEEDEDQNVEYGLNVEFIDRGHQLEINVGCKLSIMSLDDLKGLLQTFKNTFEEIIQNPSGNVCNYPNNLTCLQINDQSLSNIEVEVINEDQFDTNENDIDINKEMELLRKLFSQISKLNESEIGYKVPLYALGLDSVGGIQLAARARKIGIDIGVSDIYVGESILGIRKLMDERKLTRNDTSKIKEIVNVNDRIQAVSNLKLRESQIDYVLPLLSGQRYHLKAWLNCQHTFYEPVFVYNSPTKIDKGKLLESWNRIRSLHDILRTSFSVVGDEPYQVILKNGIDDERFEVIDRDDNENQLMEFIRNKVKDEFHTPSTLYKPAVKLILINGWESSYVLFKIHHALYDAWSIPLLIKDLWNVYNNNNEELSSSNFKSLVESIYSNKNNLFNETYWNNCLNGSSKTLLPVQNKVNYDEMKQCFFQNLQIINEAKSKQSFIQNKLKLNLQSITIATISSILSNILNQSKVLVGVYHTGRGYKMDRIETLSGPCLNLLPMAVGEFKPNNYVDDLIQISNNVQKDLNSRVLVEQNRLDDIIENVFKLNDQPVFNVFINLLWHDEKIHSLSTNSFNQINIGKVTEFSSDKGIDVNSSVRNLNTSTISKQSLFLDIVFDSKSDSIGVATRCDEGIMNENQLKQFVHTFEIKMKQFIEAVE